MANKVETAGRVIKCAVVGLGRSGVGIHIKLLSSNRNYLVVGVFDTDFKRAREYGKSMSIKSYHTLVDIKSAPMAKLDMLPELLYPIDDFYKAMNDDLNTPVALAALFELATQINSVKESKPLQAGAGAHHLLKMASLFGVLQEQPEKFLRQGAGNLDIELIEDLIAQRIQARADTDWQLADQLRDKIIAQGVEISDKDGKTTWQRRVI